MPIQPGIGGERRGGSEDDLGQVDWLSSQPDLSGVHALDVEEIIEQMGDVVDLPRDHVVRAGFRLALGVRHLEHLGGSADRPQRIAQLVAQQCQELVLETALVLQHGRAWCGLRAAPSYPSRSGSCDRAGPTASW